MIRNSDAREPTWLEGETTESKGKMASHRVVPSGDPEESVPLISLSLDTVLTESHVKSLLKILSAV